MFYSRTLNQILGTSSGNIKWQLVTVIEQFNNHFESMK